MKKLLLFCLLMLMIILPASAQDAEWQLNFFEDFDDNSFAWPLGTEVQGGTTVSRSIRDSSYIWNITTSDPNFSWMGLNPGYPAEASRYRFSAEIRLPEFDPLACAGLLLDSTGDSFYGYVICNDKTYSLIRYSGGSVQTLIPYTQIKDYDSFSAFSISADISDGWADLYYNGESLDTYNIGFGEGAFGLIAMPQSVKSTDIAFGALSFESTNAVQESSFDAGSVDPNASDNAARLIKMLNMKGRIASTAGTWQPLPDKEISLAMMGYGTKEPLEISGQDLLLQTDIAWSSGYERPDYAASGCGFYIRELNSSSYIEIFAAMDGGIYVNAYRNGAFVPLIGLKYGSWSIEGSGRLAVAADAQKITILWNDAILGTVTDATWMGSGAAGYMVRSGTNGDFGTRCVFSSGEGYIFQNQN